MMALEKDSRLTRATNYMNHVKPAGCEKMLSLTLMTRLTSLVSYPKAGSPSGFLLWLTFSVSQLQFLLNQLE